MPMLRCYNCNKLLQPFEIYGQSVLDCVVCGQYFCPTQCLVEHPNKCYARSTEDPGRFRADVEREPYKAIQPRPSTSPADVADDATTDDADSRKDENKHTESKDKSVPAPPPSPRSQGMSLSDMLASNLSEGDEKRTKSPETPPPPRLLVPQSEIIIHSPSPRRQAATQTDDPIQGRESAPMHLIYQERFSGSSRDMPPPPKPSRKGKERDPDW